MFEEDVCLLAEIEPVSNLLRMRVIIIMALKAWNSL